MRALALSFMGAAMGLLGTASPAAAAPPIGDDARLIAMVVVPPQPGVVQPFFAGFGDTSPGHLARAHASMDGSSLDTCRKCHVLGTGNFKVEKLCVAAGCHADDIGVHQEKEIHFHGSKLVRDHTCGDCHTDHQGADFDMVNSPNPKAKVGGVEQPASAWGVAMQDASGSKKNWNHDLTGYKLIGGHKIDCDKCHKPEFKRPNTNERTFLGLKQECLACHDNYHHFNADDPFNDCLKCHTFITWKKFNLSGFDHDKTAFPLHGAHAQIGCDRCHAKGRPFKPVAHDSCETCHAGDGARAHGTTFKTRNCEFCHTEKSWRDLKVSTAEHKKFSKFGYDPEGAHRRLACGTCHHQLKTTPPKEAAEANNCTAPTCHNNVHGDRWMNAFKDNKGCTKCHSQDRWTPVLVTNEEHKSWANFDLTGRHLLLQCARCHRGLTDNIAEIPAKHTCDYCHVDFHEELDKKSRGKKCDNCHTTDGWLESGKKIGNPHDDPKYFFQLTGAHAQVGCGDCHKQMDQNIMKVGSNCADCHGSPHLGKLPDKCDKCHSVDAWTPADGFDHNRDSRFKLSGLHVKVACFKCHTDMGFRGTPMQCNQCHWDYHKGAWGPTDCKECHSEVHWRVERGVLVFQSLHNFGEVVLSGAHEKLACETCHTPTPRWNMNGMGGECDVCHVDVHLGGRGQECQVCHTQRQWVPVTFNHAMTGFPLYGTHRLVRCVECHRGNVYAGLPQNCVFCHYEEGIVPHGAGLTNGAIPGAPDCERCHTPTNWLNHNP